MDIYDDYDDRTKPSYKRDDVVLVPFPTLDLRTIRLRPVLLFKLTICKRD